MSNFNNADADKLMQSNYDDLRKARIEMGFDLDQLKGYESELHSSMLSHEGKQVAQGSIDNLKKKINAKKLDLDARLSARLDKFVSEHTPRLDASQITDDTRLLTCGVKLRANEIEELMKKNLGNYTMTVLLSRYAEENDLKLESGIMGVALGSTGHDALRTFANDERQRIQYALKWIDTDKGTSMLNQFYGVASNE